VSAALFAGDLYELALRTPWGAVVHATGSAGTTWSEGDAVEVTVPPDDAQVWILDGSPVADVPTHDPVAAAS
jgi:TOBE domain